MSFRHFHVCDICSVSVANNFVHMQSTAVYGYYAMGEVAHFVDRHLQKTKKSCVLPLVEHWEEYMAPKQSMFAEIDEDHFLAGTPVLVAFEKIGRIDMKREFRRSRTKFVEDFVDCVMSTLSTRFAMGQGLSFFFPPILIGGDNHAPMQLFDCSLINSSRKAGWGALRWWPASQNTSSLCKNRASWSGFQPGAALT